MPTPGPNWEHLIETRIRRVNAATFALVSGLLAGSGLFITTNWLVLKGGPVVGPHLALLGQFFIGYRVTFVGSLIGFAYALASGGLIGYVGASLYNRVADLRQRRGGGR